VRGNRLSENRLSENRLSENRLSENRLSENRLSENRLSEKHCGEVVCHKNGCCVPLIRGRAPKIFNFLFSEKTTRAVCIRGAYSQKRIGLLVWYQYAFFTAKSAT